MSTDMNAFFKRIKNLKQFTVEIDIPEQMNLSGKFPFDVVIKDNTAYFKVYAETQEEADSQVQKFLSEMQ
jgi:hypothetical protein